jgi:hypothetical protein
MPENPEGPSAPFNQLTSEQAQEVANSIKPLEDEAAGVARKTSLLNGAESTIHQNTVDAAIEQEAKKKAEDPTHLTNFPASGPSHEVSSNEESRSNLLHDAADIVASKKAEEVLERDSSN